MPKRRPASPRPSPRFATPYADGRARRPAPSLDTSAPNDPRKCYQVKDALNLAAVVDLASPQFGLEAGCEVSKAKYFCVPAEKTGISAEDKKTKLPIVPLPVGGPDTGDRICYKVKCPKPIVPIPDQPVTDQFGNRTVRRSGLAVPAHRSSTSRTPRRACRS